MSFDPVTLATPFFILSIILEMVWSRRNMPSSYEPRDTLTSLLMGLGSVVAGLLVAGFTLAMLKAASDVRLMAIGWQWWAWIACFVADDLTYYWIHRSGHRVRWFWAAHVNHHSSQHYNLSTALRQSWTSFIALGFLFRLPLAFIGFEPAMILTCVGINLVYQFWIHTEAIRRMPRWFEAVMNTPSHHRVHHAVNPQYLDRNYAGVFIVWDRLFGTFQREDDDVRIHYGIVRQLGSFNLLWTAFHEWIGILKDLWSAPWRHKLSYLWRVPGWTHDGSRQTSDMIRQQWQARQSD